METDQIIIQISGRDGQHVPVDAFVSVMRNALSVLEEVDAEISEQRQGSVRWGIKAVSYNSPLTAAFIGEPAAELDVVSEVVKAFADGLKQLEEGPARIPEFFSVKALEVSKKMVGVLNDGVERLTIRVPDYKSVQPTQRVAASVDELMLTHEEMTTFEGPLEAVNIHGKRIFYIWDAFDGRISCRFDEIDIGEVVEHFGRPVRVYGRARFARRGKPLSITVEEIEELPERQPFDPGKYPPVNITGGRDAVEYVREMRDA